MFFREQVLCWFSSVIIVRDLLFLFLGGPQPLSWATRVKIAVGAARGLCFLHDAKSQVIYRDFKASNILLDAVSYMIREPIYNLVMSFL